MSGWFFLLSFWSFHAWTSVFVSSNPNVIVFLVDDWGFNDVGYHNNTNTNTNFIDSLAQEHGLIIEKFYAMQVCSVSRSSFLTGRYAMRFGMQYGSLDYTSNFALTKQEVLLSQEFQAQGYSTHLIGKWHLGMITEAYTPTRRGFDSFVGFYGSSLDYWNYTGESLLYTAYDLRDGDDAMQVPSEGTYSLNFLSQQLFSLTDDLKDASKPFFLWVGWQGSHSPSEASASELDAYVSGLDVTEVETNWERYNFQAQTTKTDEIVKEFVKLLKLNDMWDNTIMLFASDNGSGEQYGDNSPLRGGKSTIWEGGLRLPAFITGGYLSDSLKGTSYGDYPVHVTDWYPTLLAAAGLDVTMKSSSSLDGKNMWNVLTQQSTSTFFSKSSKNSLKSSKSNSNSQNVALDALQALNSLNSLNSINSNKNALDTQNSQNSIKSEEEEEDLASLTSERTILLTANNDSCSNDVCGSILYAGRWKLLLSSQDLSEFCTWQRDWATSSNDVLGCGEIPDDVDADECNCKSSVCLFDLLNDPCEYYDVSDTYPDLTDKLYDVLSEYFDAQVSPLTGIFGDVSDSSLVDPTDNSFDGTESYWAPWAKVSSWEDLEFEFYVKSWYETDSSDASDANIYEKHQNNNENLDGLESLNAHERNFEFLGRFGVVGSVLGAVGVVLVCLWLCKSLELVECFECMRGKGKVLNAWNGSLISLITVRREESERIPLRGNENDVVEKYVIL